MAGSRADRCKTKDQDSQRDDSITTKNCSSFVMKCSASNFFHQACCITNVMARNVASKLAKLFTTGCSEHKCYTQYCWQYCYACMGLNCHTVKPHVKNKFLLNQLFCFQFFNVRLVSSKIINESYSVFVEFVKKLFSNCTLDDFHLESSPFLCKSKVWYAQQSKLSLLYE
jgi:hypothetical protein